MIKKDFTFEIDESVLLSYAGKGMERKLKDPKNAAVLEDTKDLFQALVSPMVIWDRFPIEGYTHGKVLLPYGHKMGGGPFVQVVSGAHELILAVCTVGKSLEEEAKRLMKTGSMLEGIILDGFASWGVDSIRCQFYQWAAEELKTRDGYRSSTYLSPGESSWSVDDQRVIFSLLAHVIPENEVYLTESNVMVPFKSLSMVFGIGPDEMGSEGETNCDMCTMKDDCKFRKQRAS